MRFLLATLFGTALAASTAVGAPIPMEPFVMNWRENTEALVDMSFLLDAPAGKDGSVRIKDGHLARPDGTRFRIWGANVTGSACFPAKDDARIVADHLARFGINAVRFHFLDSNWSGSLFVKGRDDTRALDPAQLDRLDYFVWALKQRGIYTNLNLNVGRTYRKDDGVRDYEYLGLAKVINYFDDHVQMLHREYAQQLLIHYNPYTESEYRHEPAVAIVELVNENSIVEAWFSDRLLGENTSKRPGTWTDITAWYAQQLTDKYNVWLAKTLSATELAKLRRLANVAEGAAIPRLTSSQFRDAPAKRFHTEARFYMHLERTYFQRMYDLLKDELGVKALIVATSDHNHYRSGYPLLVSASLCDVVDGHVYWQHPSYGRDTATGRQTFSIPNTPMVDDPLHSTVVQLARSAVAGKPYTVSETNHPFPNEYACEGIPILAAYAAFLDWDGIFFYTFEHQAPADWGQRQPRHFEIRPDPVKMTNIAAGAGLFLRHDVRSAQETLTRSYSPEQLRESIRASSSQRPLFTPGFDRSIPLRHGTQILSFERSRNAYPEFKAGSPIVSDTGQLRWYHGRPQTGLVTVETEKSQAMIGFVKQANRSLPHLSAEIENEFCSIILTSLDGKAIARASELLLATTARAANTNMKWNEDRTSLEDWGSAPTAIEPVRGTVTLQNLTPFARIEVIPLDSAARPLFPSIPIETTSDGCRTAIGKLATPWYLVRVRR
ncbi:MAG: hypothetical protein JSW27_18135 [Phycisphaerales bacterium]|nr:MAG: hypothetical protein JSW27_18135 [Phycisphaerales bacterium]